MPDDKGLRCDCGYQVTARDETTQVEEIRLHAREAHGIAFSVEDALVVLLRSQLDLSGAPAERSVPDGRAPKGGS
jgi:predicted small metal-binding protein